jgi:hypothetical protein
MPSLALRKDRAISLLQYERHKPGQTLLYQIIEQYYPAFSRLMEQQGRPLPFHVKKEFDDFLKCGRLEHGFTRVRCTSATRMVWSPLAANVEAFVQVVGQHAWWKAPPCW